MLSGIFSGSTPQYAYSYDHASNLTSITPNGPQQNYAYTSTNAITTGSYDANGSPLSLGGGTYTWDGANRIASYSNAANATSSTFSYDGLGRLVRVIDKHSGSITADHSYTWCGSMRCLAHDNTQTNSPVSTQYFAQGALISGTAYYYVQDRLGSVIQLVTTTGSIASQYTYDPYGNKTTVSGTVVSDIGYAGYFYHAVSGLDFALYRAYDPAHARWLNRDPIAEAGGINLYAYVKANPLRWTDPLGLCAGDNNSSSDNNSSNNPSLVDKFATPPAIDPSNLTPDQVDAANDAWSDYLSAQEAADAAFRAVSSNYSSLRASADRALQKWYAATGFPNTSSNSISQAPADNSTTSNNNSSGP